MNAVPMEPTNATAPVIQVSARRPRHAAIANLPHRWITMQAKKSSTLHRCSELTKWPRDEVCHHAAPPIASANPDASTNTSAARVATPKT